MKKPRKEAIRVLCPICGVGWAVVGNPPRMSKHTDYRQRRGGKVAEVECEASKNTLFSDQIRVLVHEKMCADLRAEIDRRESERDQAAAREAEYVRKAQESAAQSAAYHEKIVASLQAELQTLTEQAPPPAVTKGARAKHAKKAVSA